MQTLVTFTNFQILPIIKILQPCSRTKNILNHLLFQKKKITVNFLRQLISHHRPLVKIAFFSHLVLLVLVFLKMRNEKNEKFPKEVLKTGAILASYLTHLLDHY